MSLINRHGPCVGVKLFSFGQYHVQIWFCPANFMIERHSHPDEHIELMYLAGDAVFFRGDFELFKPRWYHFGRSFSVAPGVVHWFSVSKWPLIFINWSKFNLGCKPVSAAVDFKGV